MFFRETFNKNSKYPVLQLIESKRIEGQPRQKIVVSLGSDYPIPKELRKEVARIVTEKLRGQKYIFSSDEVEKHAENVVLKIQQNKPAKKFSMVETEATEIYPDQTTHTQDRISGPLIIGNEIWNRLKIDGILENLSFKKRHIEVAKISILNRLISQDAEYAIPGWTKTYATNDIISNKSENYGKDIYYTISDKLFAHKDKIEKSVYRNIKSLFSLNNSIILYDLTNSYFEGSCEGIKKAEFNGNQKEKRTDCKQIVVALILDGDGFVITHKVFNGKMSDAKSLKQIIHLISEDYGGIVNLPTLIFDRGVTSDQNIELLNELQIKYIIASRNNLESKYAPDFKNETFTTIKNGQDQRVEIYLKEEENENYLLCKSEGRANKEKAIRTKKEVQMLDKLSSYSKNILNIKKVNRDEVMEKIGKIKQEFKSVSQFYAIEFSAPEFDFTVKSDVKINKTFMNILNNRKQKFEQNEITFNKLSSDIQKIVEKYKKDADTIEIKLTPPRLSFETIEEKMTNKTESEGHYLLRTNRQDLSDENIWKIYTMLAKIEHAFRHLKTDLGLRPNYHLIDSRVEGHIFISILAYQILQTIEFTLRDKDCTYSWNTVNRIMTSHTYSTIVMQCKNGKTIHIRKAGEPENSHKEIYEMLDIKWNKLPVSKVIF